ncbi:MAG: hypothetical protein MI861_07915, partial [Pirellulales bacterium]|nr:hypothetical protein [Pirellulales bacterium]
MAMLAILVMLFTRPSLPRASRRDGDRLRLILIDRSASMAVRSGDSGRLMDAAVEQAQELIAELGPDAKVEMAYFDSSVHPVDREDDARPWAAQALIGGTRLVDAMRWARDRCLANPNDRADVAVITDLQRSGLEGSEVVGMPGDVEVHLHDVGRDVADNLAVIDFRVPGGIRLPHNPLALEATVFNFGPADHVDVPVIVTARHGAAVHYVRKTVTVASQQATDIKAELTDLAVGRWEITLDLDCEDDLQDDNRRRAAAIVADPAKVLVLDGGSPSRDETYFLRVALASRERLPDQTPADDRVEQDEDAAESGGRFRPEVVYLQEATQLPELTAYPLVVVADPGQMLAAEIESLHQYVRQGGRLMVFAGQRLAETAARDWEESGLAPGVISSPRRAGSVPYRMTSWNRSHPMLEPFADPQHGDLSRLAFDSAVPIKPAEQTLVLASFEPRLPAITEHDIGQGRILWCSVPVTGQWSRWTASPLYLPIMQQMAAELLGQTGEGPLRLRVCGSDTPPSNSDPMLRRTKTDSRGPGFYPHQETLTVVNLPSEESDIARMKPNEFYESFGLARPDAPEADAPTNKQTDSVSYDELWPWLVLALLGLMVTEYWVAGRTPG